MKIIKAMDYGFRKVIVVCLNPEDPEAVHGDGSPHTGAAPVGTDPSLRSWEWCHDCRYNWQVREYVWTGDKLYTAQEDGQRRKKTDVELLAEIRRDLQALPQPVPIQEHAGTDFTI